MYSTAYQSLGGNRCEMSNLEQFLAIIRSGLPVSILDHATNQLGITKNEYALLIGENLRTIQRKGKLSPTSSERALMLADLIDQCDKYFCDVEKRNRWLRRPNLSLGNVAPLSLCDTVMGIKLVSETTIKLAHGVSA